ncbi:MAG: hypothetical protein Q9M31_09440 [Mariprofundus sp.]|nr:hypothetical protein [Mariprofundus sp.]
MPKSYSPTTDHIGLWMLLAVAVATAALFFWSSSNYQQHGDSKQKTHIDTQGKLHVMGITLGKTNLKQAEFILKSKSDVALYIYPKEDPRAGLKMEAFFPAIADHTKVVLLLNITQTKLEEIETRATIPHQYQNLVARMNLAPEDSRYVRNTIVSELTLIPNLVLTAKSLKARFGEPDRMLKLKDDKERYNYKRIGLQATINKDGPPTLHFSNP